MSLSSFCLQKLIGFKYSYVTITIYYVHILIDINDLGVNCLSVILSLNELELIYLHIGIASLSIHLNGFS